MIFIINFSHVLHSDKSRIYLEIVLSEKIKDNFHLSIQLKNSIFTLKVPLQRRSSNINFF